MTVGELKEYLDNYGDHLPVYLAVGSDPVHEADDFSVETGTDQDGMACIVLESA